MYFVLEVSVAPVGAVIYFYIIDCGLWFESSRCHDFSMWELLFYFMNCELFLEYYLVNSYIGQLPAWRSSKDSSSTTYLPF